MSLINATYLAKTLKYRIFKIIQKNILHANKKTQQYEYTIRQDTRNSGIFKKHFNFHKHLKKLNIKTKIYGRKIFTSIFITIELFITTYLDTDKK